jgi:hypothetical protein
VIYVEFFSQRRQTHLPESYAGRLAFFAAFVVFSFYAREQPENTYVLKKADKLVRTAGSGAPAN